MSDVIGPVEVERDVSTGEHLVTFYIGVAKHNVSFDLTAEEARLLAETLLSHSEPLTCSECWRPAMPGEGLCPACQQGGDDPDAAYDRMREERDGF